METSKLDRYMPMGTPQPPSGEGWTLYAWDSRRMQWVSQPEFTNVSLEAALTNLLKWKSMGQTVRMDSADNLL